MRPQVRKFVTSVASKASPTAGDERDVMIPPGQIPGLESSVQGEASGLLGAVWAGRSLGEGRACLGLAAAGLLADGLLSGPPQGQLHGFAH